MPHRVPKWGLLCVPIALGAAIMLVGGAPVSRWGLHLSAGVIGVVAYLILVTARRSVPTTTALGFAVVGVALVASTLVGSGIEGVMRWHEVGVLRLHPSALLAPALLAFASAQAATRPLFAYGSLAALQLVHLAQPDAGQATALGAGAAAVALTGPRRGRDLGVALAFGLSAAAAWTRFDPLPPAPFVEDIVSRAFALAMPAGVVGLLSLTVFVLAPFAGIQRGRSSLSTSRARAALLVYFGGSLLAACFGEFPIPLLGFGPSPVVGAFLGLAVLEGSIRASATAAPSLRTASPSEPPPDASRLRLAAD